MPTPACSAGCFPTCRRCTSTISRCSIWQRHAGRRSRQRGRQHCRRYARDRPGGLHVSRPVRRSRHHARHDVDRRQGGRSGRHREFPHARRSTSTRFTAWGPTAAGNFTRAGPEAGSGKTPGPKFLIGKTINVGFGGVTGDHRNDLPRSPEGFALIGDHRNDENLVVAQTHLAFLKFHNAVCDRIAAPAKPAEAVFAEARRIVTWHYQWMVLHDFVERITEPGIVARILDRGRKFYRFKTPALYAGRILGRGLSLRPQHGARTLQPQPDLPGPMAPRSAICSTSPD